MIESKSEEHYA